ncbi:MAG: 6-phosphogluconolactonase [Sphaerochaeta sp.]|nr:6-phosphogluconolactonase [Sphaerochaeta sp.]
MKNLKLIHSRELVALVSQQIETLSLEKNDRLRIAIPGGRSATLLIEAVLSLPQSTKQRLQLYLVDERLGGEKNEDTLLDAGFRAAFASQAMHKSQLVIPKPGQNILEDEVFDLIYLGIGEDGHFASLFPGSYPSMDTNQTAMIKNSPKPPKERVTITYEGFRTLGKNTPVFLLFLGEAKRNAYERFLENKEHPSFLPCSFFLREGFQVTTISDLKE